MRNDRKFKRTRELSTDRLIRLAHTVKTFDGSTYVNFINGYFVEANSLKKVPVNKIFFDIRTIANTNKEIIAKRKHLGDTLYSGRLVHK